MARTAVLICYDISDPGRWRQVFETCKAFGDHMQYSVFVARLTEMGHAELLSLLTGIINHREDRVVLIRLGPDGKELHKKFRALGKQTLPFRAADDDGIF